ncbi:MAG: radical SAM protein [Candidatus Omnitrophica bacterium]|nr:radical SAM protein [Candidatus Omnitrophota bacterium]
MKVLFLKPTIGKSGQNIVRDFVYGCWCNGRRIGGMQMPPINELYVATHARHEGIEVFFLDAQMQPDAYERLLSNHFDGFKATVIMCSTQSFRHDIETFKVIKNLNPRLKTILFGSHPTFMPEYCLQEDVVDYVVRREPEETMRQLLRAILNNDSVRDIAGIGYKVNAHEIKVNPDRQFMEMDELPIPDRSLLPPDIDYFNPVVKKMPYTTMQASRGCPARCIFCTVPYFYGNKTRFRSVDKVIEELQEIKRLGYREFFFRDETFTAHKKRNIELCEMMIKKNINLSWIANARVDMIDKESLLLMKKAGCHMLKFGVETGNDKILRNYKKGTTCSQAENAFRLARSMGLSTHAHIVFGGPGENPGTINKTIAFVKRLKATTASFGILTPYPGTELFEMVAAKHSEIKDGSDSNMANLHTTGFFSETICQMKGEVLSRSVVSAYRQFYLRPNYLLERLLKINSFEELMILAVAGLNIFKFSITGEK